MAEIKVSVTDDMKNLIKKRSEKLGISNSEYLKILVNLDLSIERYQSLATYLNILYNRINNSHQKLGNYATPLQEVPLIQINTE